MLDAKTGVYNTHYSVVPADCHDWDVAAANVIVTTRWNKCVVRDGPPTGRPSTRSTTS